MKLKVAFCSLLLLLLLCSAQSQDSQVSEDSPVVAAEGGERLRTSSGPSFRLDNTVGHITHSLICDVIFFSHFGWLRVGALF